MDKGMQVKLMGVGAILLLVGVFTTSWYTVKVPIDNIELKLSIGLKNTKGCGGGECKTAGTLKIFTMIAEELGGNEEQMREETKTWLTYGNFAYFLSLLAAASLFAGAYRTNSGGEMNIPVAPERLGAILATLAALAALAFVGGAPEGIQEEGSLGFSAFAGIFGGGIGAFAAFKANKAASAQVSQDAPTVEVAVPPAAAPVPPPPSDESQEG